MLDKPLISDGTFALTVHRGIPADWPGLHSHGDARMHVFQTREFMSVWADTFGRALGLEPFFVDVRDVTGALVMQLPLAIEQRRGVRVLGFADQSCADYNAPILYPTAIEWTEEKARLLLANIEAAIPKADQILLEKMPAMVGDLVNPLFLLCSDANPESCHGSNLLRPWREIEETQAQLKTLKRKARSLEKLGEVRLIVASDEAERGRLLYRLLEQKQRRFEDTRVAGFAEAPAIRQFFEQATTLIGSSGDLHLVALEVGGELVATSWSVVFDRTAYELMIGFEAGEWAKYSPGRVLNLRYLEWARAQGLAYVDHGIGDEDWKRENCDTHVPLARMVEARTGKGRWVLVTQALMGKIRRTTLFQALRPYKWIVKRALMRS